MLNTPTSVDSLPRLRRFTSSQTQISSFAYLGHDEGRLESKNQEAKDNGEKDKEGVKKSAGTPQPSAKEDEQQEERKTQSKGEVRQTRSSEVLCQPVSEIQGPTSSRVKEEPQDRRDLVEVPLSGLKAPGGAAEGEAGGEDQKMCCGFFFKVRLSYRIISKIIFKVT